MAAVAQLVQHIRDEMGKVVVGQEELRNYCVIALLCRGHVLLRAFPELPKRSLSKRYPACCAWVFSGSSALLT